MVWCGTQLSHFEGDELRFIGGVNYPTLSSEIQTLL